MHCQIKDVRLLRQYTVDDLVIELDENVLCLLCNDIIVMLK